MKTQTTLGTCSLFTDFIFVRDCVSWFLLMPHTNKSLKLINDIHTIFCLQCAIPQVIHAGCFFFFFFTKRDLYILLPIFSLSCNFLCTVDNSLQTRPHRMVAGTSVSRTLIYKQCCHFSGGGRWFSRSSLNYNGLLKPPIQQT